MLSSVKCFVRTSLFGLLYLVLVIPATALDLEPRQWSHLPVGINFGGVGYAYTKADISFDPVLELKNVDMELHTWAAKYIRTFELFGKSARVDLTQGYQRAEWQGLLDGVSATVSREGLSDSFVRVAINLYGSPPLRPREYAAYQAGHDSTTIVGVGLAVRLPTGNYLDDKLLNLGENRYAVRPQLGLSHQRGKWSAELSAQVAFYTDNDDFFGGNKLEQDPLYIVYGDVSYTFSPGLWLAASAGYDYGGETRINGVDKEDRKQNIGWRVSGAYPLSSVLGLSVSYTNARTLENTGADSDTFAASLSYMW